LSAWLSRTLYVGLGLLWLTGAAWLILHFFFQQTSDFGNAPHPWQPPLLVVHGICAVVATFFIGWVVGTHVEARWRREPNRVTGITLLSLFGTLAVTGLCSYYVTAESVRNGAAWLHELLGALAVVPALVHWRAQKL
jgi:uncharacterized membrane protein AbrB (regulator of aidB expression)